MEKNKIIALGKAILKNDVQTAYANKSEMESKFREVLADLCMKDGKINRRAYKKNSDTIFEIMEESIDEVLPKRVEEMLGQLADIEQTDDGDTIRFKLKKGRQNVRRFVTRVAAAGVYDRVRLSSDYADITMHALGGAVFVKFEDFLAGKVTLDEVLTAMLEELESAIFEEVRLAIQATYGSLPANNKHTAASFVGDEMKKIIRTVKAYGEPTILCTEEFAADLLQDSALVAEVDKNEYNKNGFVGIYNGARVVVMEQSFKDAENTEKVFDPQYAYVVPAGADEKIIKLGLEGQTHLREEDREDWSMEVQVYKKVGVAVLNTNFFGIYRNTGL